MQHTYNVTEITVCLHMIFFLVFLSLHFCVFLFYVAFLCLILFFSVLAKRLAGKNDSALLTDCAC